MRWTLYELIGLEPTASASEIAARCRRLLMLTHPDRAGAAARGLFGLIAYAEETLTDPQKRAAYDERLRARNKRGRATSVPRPPQGLGRTMLDKLADAAVARLESWLGGKGGAA